MRKNSFRVIGLTGGIASGKTTVAKLFAQAGIPVLDADQIARKLSEKGGAAYEKILLRFGTTDRAKLRQIVFADPGARKELEGILHPLIREESERQIARIAKPGLPVIYEATLLVETGRYQDFDGLIVVTSSEGNRKARLTSRDQCTEELASQILQAQIADEKRLSVATWIIENNGTLDELKSKVQELIPRLQSPHPPLR